MPSTGTNASDKPGWRKNLETASWLIALTAVAMPVIGYLIRVGTFGVSQITLNVFYLAASTPVSQLAATAAPNVIVGLTFAGVVLIVAGPRLRTARRVATTKPDKLTFPLRDGVIALGALVVIGLFWGPFPNLLVSTGSAILAVTYLEFLAENRLRYGLVNVLPALAIVLAGAIALGILTGDIPGTQPALYTFSSSSVAPNGSYQLLGTDSGLLYLRACAGSHPMIAVDSSSVKQIRFPAFIKVRQVRSNSGLLDVLKDHAPVNIGLASCTPQ
jgi:hypothetical protein